MPDLWEFENELNPFNASDAQQDMDSDGLTNKQEYDLDTRLYDADSDGDGISDGDEVNVYNTNPKRSDSDNDAVLFHCQRIHFFQQFSTVFLKSLVRLSLTPFLSFFIPAVILRESGVSFETFLGDPLHVRA